MQESAKITWSITPSSVSANYTGVNCHDLNHIILLTVSLKVHVVGKISTVKYTSTLHIIYSNADFLTFSSIQRFGYLLYKFILSSRLAIQRLRIRATK